MKQVLLSIILMIVPMLASAQDVVKIDGIYYNLITKAKIAEVTKHEKKYSGDIVIPDQIEYEGIFYNVTKIGEEAFSGGNITSVSIPHSVTSIGKYAFSSCSRITSITIPNSVISIGDDAFQDCSRLTTITIPNSVTTIGDAVFNGCQSLLSMTIPNSVSSIGHMFFSGCSGLTSVTIPNSVTSIGDYAFYDCSNLSSVAIPNSVISIGNNAFSGCSAMTDIVIPNNIKEIKYNSFYGCRSLTSVTIPISVTDIGPQAFEGCTGLNSIIIGKNVKNIYGMAFASCINLSDIYCYAESVPQTELDAFNESLIEYATLHVPETSINDYLVIAPWSGFKNIIAIDGDTPPGPGTKKCAKPTISLVDGEIVFNCETEDVEYVAEVIAPDATSYYNEKIKLTGIYIVSVYATKEGYENSETVTAEITATGGKVGDANGDGVVNAADIVQIVNIIMDK